MIGKTYVPPSGNPDNPVLILVGEQPGFKEVRFRKPFIGPAGRELMDNVQTIGLTRSDCYFTNFIKDLDKPLKHYLDLSRKTPTFSKEGLEYRELLKKELSNIKGQIVAVGGAALFALTERRGITKWRGSVVESTLLPGRFIIGCLHPATVIPPKNQYLNKLLIQYDLLRAKRVAEGRWKPLKRDRKIGLSFNDYLRALKEIRLRGLEKLVIDYDIEIHNEELSCISFCYNPLSAVCIPFVDWQGDYFTPVQEAQLMLKIAEILEDPFIRKRGQNVGFDMHFLLRRYGIKATNVDDTMVAQQILMPDYPKGLDFIASIWTDIPYYKDEGKKFFKVGGRWEKLWIYNCNDSLVCNDAHPKQMDEIRKAGNESTYERQTRVIEPLVYMQEHGIKIDFQGIVKEFSSLGAQIDSVQKELDEIVGHPLNPNSPKQVSTYFYIEKGLKPYTKNKKVTTDEKALKRISRRGFKAAELILKIRHLTKIRSTYCNPDKFDDDNRVRCSYNPVGTKFSRLSSSENIFETGMNLQNIPHYILRYFIPDDGFIFYSYDLSQVENRIVAYVGNITPMIEAFETGVDVHRLTAALIFNKHPDDITTEDGTCPLGGGKYSERFWGKKANHGLNYDLGYKSFGLYYEIPENEAKYIVERYHTVYPGVRQSYHKYVRERLSKNRTLTNLLGRRTKLLDQWGDKLFKVGYACIPQGTAGDMINERGVNFIYYNKASSFKSVELLNQVHDSVGFQIPLNVPWETHAHVLLQIKRSLETPLTFENRTFVVPADLSLGFCLEKDSCKEIKSKDTPNNVKDFANLLEKLYGELSVPKA